MSGLLDTYPYARNVPVRGLTIGGRPALSGIDPAQVGTYVILTVRDPLCAYDEDPAEQIARKLAGARCIGRTGAAFHVGLTRSTDSDFVAGGRPGVGGYLQPWHTTVVDDWTRTGVLNGDRESAAVVTLAGLFGRRGGSICSVADNISTGEAFVPGAGHAAAIDVALDALALLHRMDVAAADAGTPTWLPRLGVS